MSDSRIRPTFAKGRLKKQNVGRILVSDKSVDASETFNHCADTYIISDSRIRHTPHKGRLKP
ncbi:hypothetical protein [Neisseria wadsworthii]|uniref:hypothetical protein n=1 Tax=Neisseria wadsworthii TaxID=607711 RepID=UPI00131BFD10|nr:hypothetical protein [Neisseria wadsworthii]